MQDEDPFAGIETVQDLPAEPSAEFIAETSTKSDVQPKNDNLIHGLKKHTVLAFVQYLKENCLGEVSPDLTVSLNAMTYGELDMRAKEFLDG